MLFWFCWSWAAVGVGGIWGWVFGENDSERWMNAKVVATCAFIALLCFWTVVLGFKVLSTQ